MMIRSHFWRWPLVLGTGIVALLLMTGQIFGRTMLAQAHYGRVTSVTVGQSCVASCANAPHHELIGPVQKLVSHGSMIVLSPPSGLIINTVVFGLVLVALAYVSGRKYIDLSHAQAALCSWKS